MSGLPEVELRLRSPAARAHQGGSRSDPVCRGRHGSSRYSTDVSRCRCTRDIRSESGRLCLLCRWVSLTRTTSRRGRQAAPRPDCDDTPPVGTVELPEPQSGMNGDRWGCCRARILARGIYSRPKKTWAMVTRQATSAQEWRGCGKEPCRHCRHPPSETDMFLVCSGIPVMFSVPGCSCNGCCYPGGRRHANFLSTGNHPYLWG